MNEVDKDIKRWTKCHACGHWTTVCYINRVHMDPTCPRCGEWKPWKDKTYTIGRMWGMTVMRREMS